MVDAVFTVSCVYNSLLQDIASSHVRKLGVAMVAISTSSKSKIVLEMSLLTSKQDELVIICCQHGVVAHLRSMS